MKIEYDGKEFNKIKELLAETTIQNIDKFLFDNKKITLRDFINLQEEENKKDSWGSASNSGYRGSASNSGDWGVSISNAVFGSVSNKAGLYSLITEFVFNNIKIGEGFPKEKIIKQNAKLIRFTKNMEGKYYTLLKNKVYEVVECDGIKNIVIDKKIVKIKQTIYY